jgi:hypothetical protein
MVLKRRILIVCACASVSLAVIGCGTEGLELGPVQLSVPLGSGTFSATDLLGAKDTVVQVDEDICNLPTEADITTLLQQVSSIDLSGFVTITQLVLAETELLALSGDFSFLSEITLSYIPKPVDGVEQDPVVMGTASAPGGFGNTIILQPSQNVDLLALILENDANPATECPKVRFEATVISVPPSAVSWSAAVDLDAYAMVNFAKVQ